MFAIGSALSAVALLASACGGSTAEQEQSTSSSAVSSSSAESTTTRTSEPQTSSAEPSPTPTTEALVASLTPTPEAPTPVGEGAACGPRGAVASFADGTTAYCARLQYTDGAAWSRDPSLAPNPAASSAMAQAGPQIGDRCMGADIGRTGTDASGNAIVCDNYNWVLNVGQKPRHPWVEDQIKMCLENGNPEEMCR